MSFLDDLKREAEEKQAQEAAASDVQRTREQYMSEVLDPTMRGLFTFSQELAKNLNYVKPEIKQSYTIPGVQRKQQFSFGDFFVEDYHEGRFNLRCVGRNNQKYRINTNTEADLEKIKDFLWRHGLRYQAREYFDNSYTKCGEFFVEGRVQVDIEFIARPETATIDVKVANYNDFETFHIAVTPEDVDENFHEELARFVVHQPSRLLEYNKYKFSEEQRRQLRDQIHQNAAGQLPDAAEEQLPSGPRGGSLLGGLFRRKK